MQGGNTKRDQAQRRVTSPKNSIFDQGVHSVLEIDNRQEWCKVQQWEEKPVFLVGDKAVQEKEADSEGGEWIEMIPFEESGETEKQWN